MPTTPPPISAHEPRTAECVSAPPPVGHDAQIKNVTRLLGLARERYESTGDFAVKGEIDRYETELERLTQGRPALAGRAG